MAESKVEDIPTQIQVFIKTRFSGFHKWPGAPDQHAYLRNRHRHEFHITMFVTVSHDNRDVEFIQLKEKVDSFVRLNWSSWGMPETDLSCEQMASILLKEFKADAVVVSEDGENGAIVSKAHRVHNTQLINLPMMHNKFDFSSSSGHETNATTVEVSRGEIQKELDKCRTPTPLQTPTHLQIRTKCFTGFEAEGPNSIRGKFTLFVPGCVGIEEFKSARAVLTRASTWQTARVYLGAGNLPYPLRTLTQRVIRHIGKPFSQIIIEVDKIERALECIPDDITEVYTGLIIVTNEKGPIAELQTRVNKNFQGIQVYRKTVTDKYIEWSGISYGVMYSSVTSLNDAMFNSDTELAY